MPDQQFSSQAWPIGTRVSMINVPWDSVYHDIVQFDDITARDAWLDDQPRANMATNRMTYVPPGGSIVLPCPATTAERYNYLYVDNPGYDITDEIDTYISVPRRYCYFITNVEYLSPAACRVALQLDMWTTWAPFMRFKRAFIVRGHAGIANRNLWDGSSLSQITPSKMRRYLAVPEEVDPGGDFIPLQTTWTDMTQSESGEAGTFIGVMSSVDLAEGWGTATNPNIKSASGSIQEGMLAGVQVVYFKTADFLALLNELRDAPWVSRNIMQVWLAPGRIASMTEIGTIHGHKYYRPAAGSPSDYPLLSIDYMASESYHWANNTYIAPKLLTAPYSFIELNTFEGSPLVIKPQRLADFDDVLIMGQGSILAPWDRIAIFPLWYGAGDGTDRPYQRQTIEGNIVNDTLRAGDFLDSAVWITELPRFSFTSDGYLNWLAQGAHSRAWSYQNNDWNYYKQALGRELAHNQAGEDLTLAWTQRAQQQQLYEDQFLIKSAMSMADALSLDILGTAGDLAKAATNAWMDWNANELSKQQFMDSNNQARRHLDENYDLQGTAMQGDYQQRIAQLSATQRDAEITPPSVVGAAGGNGWNYAQGLLGFRTRIMTLAEDQAMIVLEYFKWFGYAIHERIEMPADLRLMSTFTYWKLQESYIEGTLTESAKQTIRGIFERGTTVWNRPGDILLGRVNNGINSDNIFRY